MSRPLAVFSATRAEVLPLAVSFPVTRHKRSATIRMCTTQGARSRCSFLADKVLDEKCRVAKCVCAQRSVYGRSVCAPELNNGVVSVCDHMLCPSA